MTAIAWTDLLLPSLLSAVLVFFASFLIHAVLKLHNSEYHKFSNEDEVRAVVRKGSPAAGMYITPHCHEGKMSPEIQQKFAEGPNMKIYILPSGQIQMVKFLGKWFVYTFVVSLIAGYVARSILPAGTEYLKVFQVVGASAWLAYAWQSPADSIWAGKPWGSTVRAMADGLLYAALTAGAFGSLWPHVAAAVQK